MGNCLKNETDVAKEDIKSINPEEVNKKIINMKNYWKHRADKRKQNNSVLIKKENFASELNNSEIDHCTRVNTTKTSHCTYIII